MIKSFFFQNCIAVVFGFIVFLFHYKIFTCCITCIFWIGCFHVSTQKIRIDSRITQAGSEWLSCKILPESGRILQDDTSSCKNFCQNLARSCKIIIFCKNFAR